MLHKIKSLFLSILGFGLGFSIIYSVSNELSIERDPASLDSKLNKIVGLDRETLKSDLRKKFTIRAIDDGSEKTISFEGFSSAICNKYSEVVLVFSGEGIMVAGQSTEMKITAPCHAAQDPAEMAAIKVPIQKILNEEPRDAEFSFFGYKEKISFVSVADEWPRTWVLKKVEFKGQNQESKIVQWDGQFSEEEAPIVLEF